MSFVKEIALFLNIVIPLYFFYYQLANQFHQDDQNGDQISKIDFLQSLLMSSIVFISPILHILALLHPSHCFKGHCRSPHHHKNTEVSNVCLNNYNDAIQQEASSYMSISVPNEADIKIKVQKVKSSLNTPLIQKLKQDTIKAEILEQYQNANVNQFSAIPIFNRNSTKSISNNGRNESPPRLSRKSVVQAGRTNKFLAESLFTNSPHKSEQSIEIRKKPSIQSRCEEKQNISLLECEFCEQCQIPKYLRMKHCYRCSKCVHKYDHHCVLLNICIGEFNQKYYIGFLYAHLYNTILILKQLLFKIKENVYLDENTGIQYFDVGYVLKALSIIVIILNLVLVVYLVYLHTQFLLNGSTTYEKERRQNINFFKHINKNRLNYDHLKDLTRQELQAYHPFDYGCTLNITLLLKASGKHPIDWKLPLKDGIKIIQMKQKKSIKKDLLKLVDGTETVVNKGMLKQAKQQNRDNLAQ